MTARKKRSVEPATALNEEAHPVLSYPGARVYQRDPALEDLTYRPQIEVLEEAETDVLVLMGRREGADEPADDAPQSCDA